MERRTIISHALRVVEDIKEDVRTVMSVRLGGGFGAPDAFDAFVGGVDDWEKGGDEGRETIMASTKAVRT
jgi:hypothetical protein